MKVYTTDRIRNVVILGHGGAGKTSLAEAMAYLSGITSRMGSVTEGNTVSDYDKEEIKRKFSISIFHNCEFLFFCSSKYDRNYVLSAVVIFCDFENIA